MYDPDSYFRLVRAEHADRAAQAARANQAARLVRLRRLDRRVQQATTRARLVRLALH